MASGIFLTIGVIFYQTMLQEVDPRRMIYIMVMLLIVAGIGDLALILRWNTLIGIDDITFMLISSLTLYGFSTAFYLLVI